MKYFIYEIDLFQKVINCQYAHESHDRYNGLHDGPWLQGLFDAQVEIFFEQPKPAVVDMWEGQASRTHCQDH